MYATVYATCPIQTMRVNDWCQIKLMVQSKRDVGRPFEAEVHCDSSSLFGEGMVGSVLEKEVGELSD